MSEMMSAVTLPLEEKGLRGALDAWGGQKVSPGKIIDAAPTSHRTNANTVNTSTNSVGQRQKIFSVRFLRGIGPSVGSTMLGFVAYEYAKDIHFLSTHEHFSVEGSE